MGQEDEGSDNLAVSVGGDSVRILVGIILAILVIVFFPIIGPVAFLLGILGAVGWAVAWWAGLASSLAATSVPVVRNLRMDVEALGDPRGKTEQEIEAVLGPPDMPHTVDEDRSWFTSEKGKLTHFVYLEFEGGVCIEGEERYFQDGVRTRTRSWSRRTKGGRSTSRKALDVPEPESTPAKTGADAMSIAVENLPDRVMTAYAEWARTRSQHTLDTFIGGLYGRLEFFPRGPVAADDLSKLFPEACGVQEFTRILSVIRGN